MGRSRRRSCSLSRSPARGAPGPRSRTPRSAWEVGALANQQGSITGWSDTDVNQLRIQPFVNYNLPAGWYFTSAPIVTANFSASDDSQWTVLIGAGIGKLWRLGKVGLPLNTQIVSSYNVGTPDCGPD